MNQDQRQLKTSSAGKLKARFSFATVLIALIALVMLVFCGVCSYLSIEMIYKNKLLDTWAIFFQEMEVHARQLEDVAEAHMLENTESPVVTGMPALKPPSAIFAINGNRLQHLFGEFQARKTPKSLGLASIRPNQKWNFVRNKRGLYIATVAGPQLVAPYLKKAVHHTYLVMRKIDLNQYFDSRFMKKKSSVYYILNRSGELIYTNSNRIQPGQVLLRPLVKNFVQSTLTSGQIKFKLGKSDYFGTFLEAAGSNLVVFSEIRERIIFKSVNKVIVEFALVSFLILLISLILLQVFFQRALAPLKLFKQFLGRFNQGVFNINLETRGMFGDFAELAYCLNESAHSLRLRENRIAELNKEEQKSQMQEAEGRIAQNIRFSLLPSSELRDEGGICISAIYEPHSQLAGDWYSYHVDPETGDTIAAILDCTGQNQRSALLPGVATGIFHTFCQQYAGQLTELTTLFNAAFIDFFGQQTEVKGIFFQYRKQDNWATIINLGHQASYLFQNSGSNKVVKVLELHSEPLGKNSKPKIGQESFQLNEGDRILFHTDGLVKFAKEEETSWTREDVTKLIEETSIINRNEQLQKIYQAWKAKIETAKQADDLCLLLIEKT